ncbi:LuxR C-terminal-related transcriptional regulator [Escherichia coli]|uniref:LuxR C-terminal-related transcriptional regulator n=1 Tax=Escherichia coli TaxID=562 RepID=UPI0038B5FBAA
MSIIIVDSDAIARYAMCHLAEKNNFHVLLDTDNGKLLLDTIRFKSPDVIIIAIELDQKNLFTLINKIRERNPRQKIIITAENNSRFYIQKCLKLSVNGFFNKSDNRDLFISAINAVKNGYMFYPSSANFEEQDITEKLNLGKLSIQEAAVLKYILSGCRPMQIAQHMNISYKTVNTYKSRLMKKLKCYSTSQLYYLGMKNHMQ